MGNVIVKELCFKRDGKKIYGRMYLPEDAGKSGQKYPAVILAHGFGSNIYGIADYAENFAKNGIASYAFEFIGGGEEIRSDGEMREMSVLTEAEDFFVVLSGIVEQPGIDRENIFLMGESQGGFVATYVASEAQDKVRGLIALYPAYVLQEDARKRLEIWNEIPEVSDVMGHQIGRIYTEDALSFDIYEKMTEFHGPVLLIHGTADPVVPLSFSERAAEIFPSARLICIPGAGHGFGGKDRNRTMELSIKFIMEELDRKIL